MLKDFDDDTILKCMQIANKETAILYKDFSIDAQKLIHLQSMLKDNIITQYKTDEILSEDDKQNYIETLQNNTGYDYEFLNNIYDNLFDKYSYIQVKREKAILSKTYLRFSSEEEAKRFFGGRNIEKEFKEAE